LGGTNNEHTKWSYQALKSATRSSQFLSPILMWETIYDPYSTDTVVFVSDKDYKVGDEICVRSRINNYPIWQSAPRNITKDEKINFIDYVQNRLFVGGGGFVSNGLIGAPVFMTKQALNFTAPPEWYRVFFTGDTTEQVTNMCISEDGNHLFITTFSTSSTLHNIYRISGFSLARDSMTLSYGRPTTSGTVMNNPNCLLDAKKVYSTNSFITSISLDPKNPDVLVMTLGGDNFVPHIYASTNATSDTLLDFESNPKEGTGLPSGKTPIYTALVEMNNSDIVFVGTEKGIYVTENFSSVNPLWEPANDGIGVAIPVFMLKQQTKSYPDTYARIYGEDTNDVTIIDFKGVKNTGYIYAATHGRGIFKNRTYQVVGIEPYKPTTKTNCVNIYPNPTNDNVSVKFDLTENVSNVKLSIYNITGKKILSIDLGSRLKGNHTEKINLNALPNGLYLVRIQGGDQIFNGKIVVTK
ncbi:MAG: T9SS type A sorting domain-containing protein, partial [Bacteroidales bacterium]|nr:T9SS type A sorting domain-containing protein [Bacteroidales bacterium]